MPDGPGVSVVDVVGSPLICYGLRDGGNGLDVCNPLSLSNMAICLAVHAFWLCKSKRISDQPLDVVLPAHVVVISSLGLVVAPATGARAPNKLGRPALAKHVDPLSF
ncbi:hypothetical protein L2E82_47719 [Cichorium intybus]|uniref:Uncharacterized protein n=1 Tax=Cichorium intybus TaxID=13427 RepID=A0ACB8YVI7_CICIN|nr:hypothetical protein L2E82_47719 [Cichorium intybus]